MSRTRVRFIISSIAILLVVAAVYYERVRIGAWVWHLRHGTTTTVGGYVIPAPRNWYVEDVGNGTQLLVRLDTEDRTSTQRVKAHAAILVLLGRLMNSEDINHLMSAERNLMEHKGVKSLSQREFNLDGDTLACLGGDKPGSNGIYDSDPISWQCRSSGGLDLAIAATEPDLNQVWDIVAHIRLGNRKPSG